MPKGIDYLKNGTGLVVCDMMDSVMKITNQQARQIQSSIIEGQSARAGATLAFEENKRAIANIESLRSSVTAILDSALLVINGAKHMEIDADQLDNAGTTGYYAKPADVPMGDN